MTFCAPKLQQLGDIVDEMMLTQLTYGDTKMKWFNTLSHNRWLEQETDRIFDFGKIP